MTSNHCWQLYLLWFCILFDVAVQSILIIHIVVLFFCLYVHINLNHAFGAKVSWISTYRTSRHPKLKRIIILKSLIFRSWTISPATINHRLQIDSNSIANQGNKYKNTKESTTLSCNRLLSAHIMWLYMWYCNCHIGS